MGVQSDAIKVVGKGVVTGWTPEDLQRKYDLENDLIARGFEGLALEREARRLLAERYGVLPNHEAESHNALVAGGLGLMMDLLIGAGGTVYSNANAFLGVGDSSTANSGGPPPTNTDLASVSNKLRKAMDATYPSRATNVLTFRSTFATTDANYIWNEWGIFNAASAGTMLNRATPAGGLGTKTSASAWQLTATITIT